MGVKVVLSVGGKGRMEGGMCRRQGKNGGRYSVFMS